MGLPSQIARRAIGHDPSLVDDEDAVARGLHLGQDVGAEDDRLGPAHFLDQLPDLHDLVGVQSGRGLIEDEHLGIVDHRLGQADALAVALAKLSDALVFLGIEAAHAHHLGQALADPAIGQALHACRETQVVEHGHVLVQWVVLRQIADVAADGLELAQHRPASDMDAARIRCEQAADHLHGGGLPGAVGTQETEHLTGPHHEADAIHRGLRAVALGEAFDADVHVSGAKISGHVRRLRVVCEKTLTAWVGQRGGSEKSSLGRAPSCSSSHFLRQSPPT